MKNQLVSGGELVLKALVIEGDQNQALVPGERYAQMRNVYFIPSPAALIGWLEKCGFVNVRQVDMSVTNADEQRRTMWMISESLADFLHPDDQRLTIEGHPAPRQASLPALLSAPVKFVLPALLLTPTADYSISMVYFSYLTTLAVRYGGVVRLPRNVSALPALRSCNRRFQ